VSSAWDWDTRSLGALEAFLSARDLVDAPISTQEIGDGHSNLTYLVTDGRRRLVVRRPPPPPLPPGGHDVLREARLLQAVEGSAVPAPRVLATAAAGEVVDVPLVVMEYVDGTVVTDRTPEQWASAPRRRAVADSLVDTLADLHALDWRAAGLDGLGRPEGFNTRHLARMARLVVDHDGALPPAFVPVHAWLATDVPAESGESLVHLDYRLGNVMLGGAGPQVVALLDWELATLGDPLFDLAAFLTSWPERGVPLTPTQEMGRALLEDGYPGHHHLVERYASRSGRDVSRLPWHLAFAQWKLAVLFEYGRRRAETGMGDPYYAGSDKVESFLAAAGRAAGA
jgi:aminoglycoside phosphotransferase (APT) family kinase protein